MTLTELMYAALFCVFVVAVEMLLWACSYELCWEAC